VKPTQLTTPLARCRPPRPTTVPVALIAQLQAVLTTADQIACALQMGQINPAEVERLEALEPRVLHTCHELLAHQLTQVTP